MDSGILKRLVGQVRCEDLRYVDCFLSKRVALFMPQGGACLYALTPGHTHPAYMFVLNFDDRTSIRLGGRVLTAGSGRLLALAPGIEHQELPSEEPPRYIAAMIDPELFDNAASEYKSRLEFMDVVVDAPRCLLPLMKQFMLESLSRLPGKDGVLSAIGIQITHCIIRGLLKLKGLENRVSDRLEINRAVEYIHSHISEKLTAGGMARAAGMSASHFGRVFKDETGHSPMEYLQKARLELAKKLILAGDMSITEAALASGFSGGSYLSERFKSAFGMTPSEFKESMKSKK